MEVVFRDAGGQLYDDAVFIDSFLFFDPAGQVVEFAMQRPAAAAATGQIQRAIGFVPGIAGKTAGAFVKCCFAIIAGASFFNDMTLHNDDVIFAFQIDHIPNIPSNDAVINEVLIFVFWGICRFSFLPFFNAFTAIVFLVAFGQLEVIRRHLANVIADG